MTLDEEIAALRRGAAAFEAVVEALPEEMFLRSAGGWSPRDITAHLIGWNRYMAEGCEDLRDGAVPFYYADAGNDFSDVNGRSVERYGSRDRRALLAELRTSLDEFIAYLRGLPPDALTADFGVRYRDRALSVRGQIRALAHDYEHHADEVRRLAS